MRKKFLIIASFIAISQAVCAQILSLKSDIINYYGSNYESGKADDGSQYIIYENKLETEASGEYTQFKVIYFLRMSDGKEICSRWKVIEPSSETNSNVAKFKKSYVEIGYLKWKDYENSILYTLEVKDGYCIINAFYDGKE